MHTLPSTTQMVTNSRSTAVLRGGPQISNGSVERRGESFSNILDPHLAGSSRAAPTMQSADCILVSDEILRNLCTLGFEKWDSSKRSRDCCLSGELQDGWTQQGLCNTDTKTLSHDSTTLGPQKT